MKKKIIVLNVVLGLLFIISITTFAFLLKMSGLWGEVEGHILWSGGVNLDRAKEFQDSFYILTLAEVFTALSALLSIIILITVDVKINDWKDLADKLKARKSARAEAEKQQRIAALESELEELKKDE